MALTSSRLPAVLLRAGQQAAPTPARQKQDLLLLASSIDPKAALNWKAGTDPCKDWEGVTCGADGLLTAM